MNPVRRMRHQGGRGAETDIKVVLPAAASDARWQLVPGSHITASRDGRRRLHEQRMVFVDGCSWRIFLAFSAAVSAENPAGLAIDAFANPTEMVAAESGQQMTAMFWHWRRLFAVADRSVADACGPARACPAYVWLTACR